MSNIYGKNIYQVDTTPIQGRVGQTMNINGTTYMYVSVAAATRFFKGDALKVTAAGVASQAGARDMCAVAACSVNALAAIKYAWVIWNGAVGLYVNYVSAVTADSDLTGTTLVWSIDGRVIKSSYPAIAQGASGSVSGSELTASEKVTQDIMWSRFLGIGTGTVITGAAKGDTQRNVDSQGRAKAAFYFTYDDCVTAINVTAAPISATLRVGDILTIGGESVNVTVVDNSTTGISATLQTGFTVTGAFTAGLTGYSASALAFTGIYIGQYQVPFRFK